MVVLENTHKRRCHERLAEADNVSDHHAAALVEMVRGDLDGSGLKLEKSVAEIARNLEFV